MNVLERFDITFGECTNFRRNKTETLIFAKDTKTNKEYELTCCLSVAELATDMSREFGCKITYSPCDFTPLKKDANKGEAYDYLGMLRQEVRSNVSADIFFDKFRGIANEIKETATDYTVQSSTIDEVIKKRIADHKDLLSDAVEDLKNRVCEALTYNGYKIE